jgi:hypothetical protein
MPGPKKGSAPAYVRPKGGGRLPTQLGAKVLPGRRYELPTGEILSNRKFRERVRAAQYGLQPMSAEKFAKLNRTINKQVKLSAFRDRPEEGRAIALRAAAMGQRAGANSFTRRLFQDEMYNILRNELGYDEPDEIVWWEDDEYRDSDGEAA